MARIVICIIQPRKSTILAIFCDREIPGLQCHQSWCLGLVKMVKIQDAGIAKTSRYFKACTKRQT